MKPKVISYNSNLKKLAKELRNNSTLSEVLLWNELKNKKLKGFDFHRQKPIGNYIVDFYCVELNLVIEIDGSTHNGNVAQGNAEERQSNLENLGLKILRFDDKDIKTNLDGIIKSIELWIEENTA